MDTEGKVYYAVRQAVANALGDAKRDEQTHEDFIAAALPAGIIAGLAAAGIGIPTETISPVAPRTVRHEVEAFAYLMERQLKANDHKPGWKNDDPLSLLDRLVEEVEELRLAINDTGALRPSAFVIQAVAKEAADVANFAMMIADFFSALPTERPLARQEGN